MDIHQKNLMVLPHGKSGNGSWTLDSIEEGKPASEKAESTSFLPKPDLDAPPSERENP